MPKPISRTDLIKRLKKLGFSGPFMATRHQYMLKGTHKIFIPNPHGKDIGAPLLSKILRQIDISFRQWEQL